jgi:hypothetical protein
LLASTLKIVSICAGAFKKNLALPFFSPDSLSENSGKRSNTIALTDELLFCSFIRYKPDGD